MATYSTVLSGIALIVVAFVLGFGIMFAAILYAFGQILAWGAQVVRRIAEGPPSRRFPPHLPRPPSTNPMYDRWLDP